MNAEARRRGTMGAIARRRGYPGCGGPCTPETLCPTCTHSLSRMLANLVRDLTGQARLLAREDLSRLTRLTHGRP